MIFGVASVYFSVWKYLVLVRCQILIIPSVQLSKDIQSRDSSDMILGDASVYFSVWKCFMVVRCRILIVPAVQQSKDIYSRDSSDMILRVISSLKGFAAGKVMDLRNILMMNVIRKVLIPSTTWIRSFSDRQTRDPT